MMSEDASPSPRSRRMSVDEMRREIERHKRHRGNRITSRRQRGQASGTEMRKAMVAEFGSYSAAQAALYAAPEYRVTQPWETR